MFVVCVIGGFLIGTFVTLKLKESNNETNVDATKGKKKIKPIIWQFSSCQYIFLNKIEFIQ